MDDIYVCVCLFVRFSHCLVYPASSQSRLCMVGDRLDTDVVFGNDNGLSSVLVLSGVTTEARLLSAANQIAPDFYCDDITKLLSH